MKKQIVTFIGVLATVLLTTVGAHAEIIENVSIDLSGFTVNVPCADGGAGEDVVFEGNLHMLIVMTIDEKGGVHLKEHFQPQGLQGVGVSTGDKYQATGVTQDVSNGKIGQTFTFINNFRMIGQGPGNNYLVHEVYHLTVNANGEITVEHDNLSTECK